MEAYYTGIVLAAAIVFFYLFKRGQRIKDNCIPPGVLGRALDSLETLIFNACERGCLCAAEVLFLETKQPLSVDTIRRALKRIGLRNPLLRMRITRRKDGQLVFREMENYEVDFRESDTGDWVEEFERQLKMPYDTQNGP